MPARRYYARRYYNKKRKWTRCQQRFVQNFPVIQHSRFSSISYPIFYTNNNNTSTGAATPSGSTRKKVKNIKVQLSLFDSNEGEFWLISIVYMPNAANIAAELVDQDITQLAAKEYSYLNPNFVMAQKKVTINDYDNSDITLYTRLSKWIDPGASLRVVVTHGSESLTAATNAGGVSFWSSFYVTDN